MADMETLEKPLTTHVKVLKEEDCLVTLSVELSREEVLRETEAVFQQIQSRASLPGFRVGKAPMELVRRNFSDRARQTVLENLVGRASTQVIRERKLEIVDTPRVEKVEFEFGKPILFHLRVEKDPVVKAKDYKGIKVTRPSTQVTEDMVARTLEEIRERNASLVSASATRVEKTHFAVVDFEGKIDGKAFAGGSAKNYLLDMGQPQTIAGFSEGILGADIGNERAINVQFPKDYTRKEWAGREAVFQVTVKEIKEKKLPNLDDEFAKDIGLTTLEELKGKVRENLQKEQDAKADKEVEDQVTQSLLNSHKFSVPPTLVEERVRTLTHRALLNLQRQGLVAQGDQQAESTLREKMRPQAEKDVHLSYLFKAISQQEKLEAGPADVEELKKKALAETKDSPENVAKYFQERDLAIRASLTETKVLDFLKNNAKIKTAKE
jgi:trigger factor